MEIGYSLTLSHVGQMQTITIIVVIYDFFGQKYDVFK